MADPANDVAIETVPATTDQAAPASEQPEWSADDDWDFDIEPGSFSERLPAVFLTVTAIAWIGFVSWAAYSSAVETPLTLTLIANWIAIGCIPLALLGIIWGLLRRSSTREARRFGRTAEAIRTESRRLDASMASVSNQLSDMRAMVEADTDRIIALGDEAAGRLGALGEDLRSASGSIEEKSALLDQTAKSARENVEVLLADLPRAQEQAQAVSIGFRDAGINAHEQAAALDTQLLTLKARGEEANAVANSAAQTLAANLARVEGVAEIAATKLGETGMQINATVEHALELSGRAAEDTRLVVDQIGTTLASMVDDARANFDKEGEEAAAALNVRIEATSDALDLFDSRLTAQQSASTRMLRDLDTGLTNIEAHFASLGEQGAEQAGKISTELESLRTGMVSLGEVMGGNSESAERLITRAAEVKAALDLSAASLSDSLPQALAETEERADRLKTAIASISPDLETLKQLADATKSYISVSGESISDQQSAIDSFVEQVGERIAHMRQDIDSIESGLTASSEQANSIAQSAAPHLIESLLQVKETAEQAAEKARAAFGDIIPQSAAALTEATRLALNDALGQSVDNRLHEIVAISERAVSAAREATEIMDEKLALVEAKCVAIDNRIEEAEIESEASSMDGFARRVTLLIESLNSTAIDVTKILSNDVTDTAWAAYLKGDRGIFARRAVRLLDTGESREIAAQYENNNEFRDQVNRYVHDFEAMLRRVLATRDGSPLAVTLLSSDNGKLYVALAQAIERLRA
jgi:hypothetical protein